MSSMRSNTGVVMTVEGPLTPDSLGVTMAHEHLLIDLTCWQEAPITERQKSWAKKPLSMDMLGEVRRNPNVFEDNLVMADIHVAAAELAEYEASGGRTVVDVTNTGLGQNPIAIREIGRRANVQIILGCGYYVKASHPPEVASSTVDSLTEHLLTSIRHGLGDTGLLPGVIGEIGTGEPVHPDEWKVLDAACAAQLQSGLPLSVHVHPVSGRTAPAVVERVLRNGVPPSKTIICHMDGNMDIDYQVQVAETGVYIAYDCFGLEVYFDGMGGYRCHDSERERGLLALLARGYANQILLSQDVCMKAQLLKYGGYGYDHVLRHIVPSLTRLGVDSDTLNRLLVHNPARAFTIG